MKKTTIVITGGGTAGHVFPAILIGKELEKTYQAKIYYLGNSKHIEKKLATENGFEFIHVNSSGFEGENIFDKYIDFSIKNSVGVVQTIAKLLKIKPKLVVATGGFASFPVVMAAKFLKIPFVIHEQNTVMGKVNKIASKWAETIYYSFPNENLNEKNVWVGNPVRFNEKLNKNGNKVIFFGGSGGSRKINDMALVYSEKNKEKECVLITGEKLYQEYMDKNKSENLTILNYVDDMQSLYQEAKVIVARSGAGTIFEIANLNIPNILIPLPVSSGNHQKKNAEYLSKKKATILIEEADKEFEEKLEKNINSLYNDMDLQNQMKKELESLSNPFAEKTMVKKLKRFF